MSDELKKLERENDQALVDYWKAVILVDECEAALRESREAMALHLARDEYRQKQEKMAAARLKYLEAKIAEESR